MQKHNSVQIEQNVLKTNNWREIMKCVSIHFMKCTYSKGLFIFQDANKSYTIT